MEKAKKGVRLDHISKIYKDPKTGKDFYAVKDTCLEIQPPYLQMVHPGLYQVQGLKGVQGFLCPVPDFRADHGAAVHDYFLPGGQEEIQSQGIY